MYSKYEKHFHEIYDKSEVKYKTFPHHVDIVRCWAEKLCDSYPEADREVVVIAALFHDLGHFVDGGGEDHSVDSEVEARRFLEKDGAPEELIEKVCHAVRAHRNNDVNPKTLEAKIVVFADSASHLTTTDVYLVIAADWGKKEGYKKLERDYRDLDLFPEFKKDLEGLYQSWKKILDNFPEDFLPFIRDIE